MKGDRKQYEWTAITLVVADPPPRIPKRSARQLFHRLSPLLSVNRAGRDSMGRGPQRTYCAGLPPSEFVRTVPRANGESSGTLWWGKREPANWEGQYSRLTFEQFCLAYGLDPADGIDGEVVAVAEKSEADTYVEGRA